jgi:hypothetical protein
MPTFQNTPSVPSSYAGRCAYEDGTEFSKTSAYKILTPGNYPEENIQHLEHKESLKSRNFQTFEILKKVKLKKNLPKFCINQQISVYSTLVKGKQTQERT